MLRWLVMYKTGRGLLALRSSLININSLRVCSVPYSLEFLIMALRVYYWPYLHVYQLFFSRCYEYVVNKYEYGKYC